MYRKIILALLLTCSLPATAYAVIEVTVGDWLLIQNWPDNQITVLVSGGDPIETVDLVLEIGDEFSPNQPIITAVDLVGPGTIFHDNNSGLLGLPIFPLPGRRYFEKTSTASGTVAADGVLAHVTISTVGIYNGFYPLRLHTISSPQFSTSFGIPITLNDGVLFFLPEPTSVVLGFFALAGLCLVAVRRRRRVC